MRITDKRRHDVLRHVVTMQKIIRNPIDAPGARNLGEEAKLDWWMFVTYYDTYPHPVDSIPLTFKPRIYGVARDVAHTGGCKPWRVYYVVSRAIDECWDASTDLVLEGRDARFTYEDALVERAHVEEENKKVDAWWRDQQPIWDSVSA